MPTQDDGGEGGTPVIIKSIVPGGSCDLDGNCNVGDAIIAVNSEKVANLPVVQVREKIVGPTGTSIVILFKRPNGDFYEVGSSITSITTRPTSALTHAGGAAAQADPR